MKKLVLVCLCGILLTACYHTKTNPGRVGQMYFTTVFFDSNGQDIALASYKFIDEAVKVYKKNPQTQIEVRGYTDSSGNEASNLQLSKKRAETVAKALQLRGVPADNISATGYGSAKPIVSNQTPEGRQQNRRVEIEFPYPEN